MIVSGPHRPVTEAAGLYLRTLQGKVTAEPELFQKFHAIADKAEVLAQVKFHSINICIVGIGGKQLNPAIGSGNIHIHFYRVLEMLSEITGRDHFTCTRVPFHPEVIMGDDGRHHACIALQAAIEIVEAGET